MAANSCGMWLLFGNFFYLYTVEAKKHNWSLFLVGLVFWGMDWYNEIWNSLVLHFTGYAPV